MISDYITKIKANISIYATQKTSSVLDGTYTSVFMGRSMNFEDLREYVPGDSIRDIDWKASSRSRNLLVKRYVAEKKHNILLLCDSGIKMTGDTPLGSSKKEVALYTMGTVSYLAYKNGDNIGAIYSQDGLIKYHSFKTGLPNVQQILTAYDKEGFTGKSGQIGKTIDYIINNFRRKMIIFIITDMKGMASITEPQLKRLICRHDVLFVNIGDADVTGGKSFDVDTGRYIPAFVSGNKKLMRIERKYKEEMREANNKKLVKYGIINADIDSEKDIAQKIIELLERHRHANIR